MDWAITSMNMPSNSIDTANAGTPAGLMDRHISGTFLIGPVVCCESA
jgi:hypothetical protein